MNRSLLAAFALSLLAQGCAIADAASPPEPGDQLVLSVGEGIDESSARSILDAWRARSGGLVDAVVGTEHPDARVEVGSKNEFSRIHHLIQVAPASSEIQAVMIDNSIGRMLGMQHHDGEGVLGKFPTSEWTEADRASCRDAGWCS